MTGPLMYASLDFTIRAADRIELPPFKGSALRGGLGVALRAVGNKDIRFNRMYHEVFETRVPRVLQEVLHTGETAPHPFVLEPPMDARLSYGPGDHMAFRMNLFGTGVRFAPAFCIAFDFLGRELGLGSTRGKFVLVSVRHGDRVLWQEGSDGAEGTDGIALPDPGAAPPSGRITFATPTSMPKAIAPDRGRGFDHEAFVRHAYRRLFQIACLWGDIPASELQKYGEHHAAYSRASDTTRVVRSSLQVAPVIRRTSRFRGEETPMRGFTGYADLEGEGLGILWPLLRCLEVIHIGKWTAFGFGKVQVEAGSTPVHG